MSKNYLIHYGVKGMKWDDKKKKGDPTVDDKVKTADSRKRLKDYYLDPKSNIVGAARIRTQRPAEEAHWQAEYNKVKTGQVFNSIGTVASANKGIKNPNDRKKQYKTKLSRDEILYRLRKKRKQVLSHK